ncbi:MAG TPA: LysR family transcriptional regulator [Sphaerochaeta sp.]|nr:LysR family transcriptional regulator [Sphaerochaeta sp.]
MELKVKLYLTDEEGEKYMGIGVLWLLERVAEHGSLRKAAMSLGISYTKALGMVQNLEEQLGMAVLHRRKGGSERGGATVTEFGAQFIEAYRIFDKEAKRAVEAPYARFLTAAAELIDRYDTEAEEEEG